MITTPGARCHSTESSIDHSHSMRILHRHRHSTGLTGQTSRVESSRCLPPSAASAADPHAPLHRAAHLRLDTDARRRAQSIHRCPSRTHTHARAPLSISLSLRFAPHDVFDAPFYLHLLRIQRPPPYTLSSTRTTRQCRYDIHRFHSTTRSISLVSVCGPCACRSVKC